MSAKGHDSTEQLGIEIIEMLIKQAFVIIPKEASYPIKAGQLILNTIRANGWEINDIPIAEIKTEPDKYNKDISPIVYLLENEETEWYSYTKKVLKLTKDPHQAWQFSQQKDALDFIEELKEHNGMDFRVIRYELDPTQQLTKSDYDDKVYDGGY